MHIFIHKYIYIYAFHQSITLHLLLFVCSLYSLLVVITRQCTRANIFFFFALIFLLLFNTEKYVVRRSFQYQLEVYGATLDEACKPCQLSCFQHRYHSRYSQVSFLQPSVLVSFLAMVGAIPFLTGTMYYGSTFFSNCEAQEKSSDEVAMALLDCLNFIVNDMFDFPFLPLFV